MTADIAVEARRRRAGGAGRLRGEMVGALPDDCEAVALTHWAEFVPFLAFPPEVRRVVYTTNLIESMNARLRKVTRNRGQFPTEQALTVPYLAVRNLDEYRGATVGTRSSGWKQALQAVTIYFEGRFPAP